MFVSVRRISLLLVLLALASPVRADGTAAGRDCRVLPSSESAQARVRCEDDGEEFFFGAPPMRLASFPAWSCSTVEARLTDDPSRTTGEGTLATVSIETREQRDRRTQEDDLLRASLGKAPVCWNFSTLARDNPRARAQAEAERKAREEEAARTEAERKRLEAERRERERLERILAPHNRPPRNATEELIQRTTPNAPRKPGAPDRLEICFAVDRSISMAGTYEEMAERFDRLAEAWRYHYPAGVQVTALGFGQDSAEIPFQGSLLLDHGSPSRLAQLLKNPRLASGGSYEPALDAVADCASRFRKPFAPGTRREIILATDESGDLLPGSPDGLELQRRLRHESIGFQLLDPRAGGCPDTLSNSSSEAVLEGRFSRVIRDDELFIECSTAALRYALWQGQSAKGMHDKLEERLFESSSSFLWINGGPDPRDEVDDGLEDPYEDFLRPSLRPPLAP